jgi:glutamyl-tRNA reductase
MARITIGNNALVDEGARHYLRELRVHEGQAVLRRFRDKATDTQRRELAKARAMLADGVDAEEVLAQLARSLTNKLIHEPTIAIRNASADDQAETLELLKNLYEL